MSKIVMRKGVPAFFCPACQSLHLVDTRFIFNYDHEKPSFQPAIKLAVGPFPPGHPLEGRMIECHSRILKGEITFLETSTHELKGQSFQLEDFEEVQKKRQAQSQAMHEMALKAGARPD